MKVQEISRSISGELPVMGAPCLIIRLAGCNLQCPYCDAPNEEGEEMTIAALAKRADEEGLPVVLITGGEPLLQSAEVIRLAHALSNHDKEVILETNGTIPIDDVLVSHIVMDVKLFEDVSETTLNNLHKLAYTDAVKFVYRDAEELQQALRIVSQLPEYYEPMIIFSPVDIQQPYTQLVINFSQMRPDLNIRLQVQIHKLLNTP